VPHGAALLLAQFAAAAINASGDRTLLRAGRSALAARCWLDYKTCSKGDREVGWEIRMQEHFLVKEQSKSQGLRQLDQLDQYS